MTGQLHHPWLHRLAVLTAGVALLPIAVGAVVTTKKAGMAFPDWPTSDGHGMFAYPWLESAGAKFLEHGHRLAGIVIGLASIVLCAALVRYDRRGWVRLLGVAVLLAVIVQGLLGGFRVLRNADDLALVHALGAALVFGLLSVVAVATSRGWGEPMKSTTSPGQTAGVNPAARMRTLSIATCICVFVQLILGGLLRHKGMVLLEHLGFAFVAAAMVIWLAMAATASGLRWLRSPAVLLVLLTMGQMGLGAGAWATKFGFDGFGYVAVYNSTPTVAFRSLHTLTGILLFGACVGMTCRIARVQFLFGAAADGRSQPVQGTVALPSAGGVP